MQFRRNLGFSISRVHGISGLFIQYLEFANSWIPLLSFRDVLVLASVELIFFIVASIRQCIGFMLKTVLMVTQRLFNFVSRAYTESTPFLLLTPLHQRVAWGCTRRWAGKQMWQLTQSDQKNIPSRMTSCSTYKARGRRIACPAFLEMVEHLPANGK